MVARFRTAKAAKIAMMNAALKHFGLLTVKITTCEQDKKYGGGFSARLGIEGSELRLTAHNDENWVVSYSPVVGTNLHGFEYRATSAEAALRMMSEELHRVAREYLREAQHITLL